LGGSAAGNYTLVGITTNGSSVTVGQMPVILSGAKTYDATTGAPAAGLTITNNLSGANLTLSGSGTLASANAGSESFAGAGTFALGGSAAGNYTLSSITTNGSAVTVGKLPVVLTGMRVYDATTAADTASSALAITNDLDGTNLTLSGTGTLASANAGSEHFAALGTLLLGGSAASNYTTSGITTNGSAVSITPATLTYTANPASGLSGAPIPPLSGTVPATEFKGSDTLASATTGTLVFTTMATPASGAGSYAINGSGLSANFGNYVFVQAAANATALTLGGSQTVTGDVFSDHGVSALTGASIGLVLGGTNEGTVTSGAGGAYEFVLPAGTISPSGTGLFVFIASGPVTGNSFYNAATSSLTGLDIYGNVFRVLNAPPSLMQTGTALAATLGSISNPARFLFTLGGGGAIGLGGSNFELAGPAPFTIDETVSAASFAVTAGGITLADNVTTTGAQTYSGSVTVPGPGVTLAGSNVTFTSAIEGPGTLAINGPGTVTLGGPVGDVVPLGGLTVTAGTTVLGAGIWTSSGIVMLRSNVTLTQNTMIDTDGAGADIDLMGPVSGSAYTLTLEPGVGDVTLSGVSVGGLVFMPSAPALVTLDSGSYTIAGGAYTFGAVDLDGSLSFGEATSFGPATVIGPSTITSPGAPITFTSTLMGSGTTLSIEPGTGAVSYAEMPVGVTVINVPPPSTSTAPPASDVDAVDSGSSTASGASTGTTGTSETGTTSTSDSGTSDTSGTTTSGTTTASTGTPAPTGGATGDVISDETATLLNALAPAAGPTAAPSGAGPLEILTDSSTSTDTSVGAGGGTTASVVVVTANAFTVTTTGTGEAAAATAASLSQQTAPGAETDSAADSIANSLGGTPGAPAAPGASQSGKPVTLVNGVLSQTPAAPGNACSGGTSTAAACKPHSVPPADQEYSSWGNEAFWQ
ncbi:MAG TPA: YDG domain-containing protein, partial [Stellaceae bacterium]|nr:YDG domain-containing protein [Stellaceae bacterium]